MTTPPHEPKSKYTDLYSPPADPRNPDPFAAFPTRTERPAPSTGRSIGSYDVPEPIIPVAPHRDGGASWKLALVLTLFALLLGAAIFWLATDDIDFGGLGTAPATVTSALGR